MQVCSLGDCAVKCLCVLSGPSRNVSSSTLALARPPSPERPSTPTYKPPRRRHLIPAVTDPEQSPQVSASWAGSNTMFAPMRHQLPGGSARMLDRPASASAAESASYAESELSWAGPTQLPAGLLKLTARPQHPLVGRKDKHQYDWGFGKSSGLL